MATRYELEPLSSEEASRWDELIADYESRELFHRQAWLDYLAASRGVQIRKWAIREHGRIIGYFCGGILRKGPFRILGSPLKGWGTNFMGPVVDREFDQDAFLQALDRLAHEEHIAMTELECRTFPEACLEAARYEAVPGWTYLVPVILGTDVIWNKLDSTCRNRIRKAIRSALTIEHADDVVVAAEFYDRYTDLMRRKGLPPPYPPEYPQLMFRYLKKADLLFALRVRDPAGDTLAVGLFPHDGQTVYFWGGASYRDGRDLCPNDYLHWSAMRLAAERGLASYDMCGYGPFKKKFGGQLVKLNRWHKCYWQTARWARKWYELYHQRRVRLQGLADRLLAAACRGQRASSSPHPSDLREAQ